MEKINSLAYSNGKLAFSYDEGKVAILEIKTGETTRVGINFRKPTGASSIDIRGDYIAACNYEAIIVNWKTGETLFSTRGTGMMPDSVLFANDSNKVIITGHEDVLIYNIATGTYFNQFVGLNGFVDAAILDDDTLMCADYTGYVHFFSMNKSKSFRHFEAEEEVYGMAVAEQDGVLYLWNLAFACKFDIQTGQFIRLFATRIIDPQIDSYEEEDLQFESGILSHRKDMLISAGRSDLMYLWNTTTGELIKTLPSYSAAFAVTENNILYTGGKEGGLYRWNLDTFEGEEVHITGLD